MLLVFGIWNGTNIRTLSVIRLFSSLSKHRARDESSFGLDLDIMLLF